MFFQRLTALNQQKRIVVQHVACGRFDVKHRANSYSFADKCHMKFMPTIYITTAAAGAVRRCG